MDVKGLTEMCFNVDNHSLFSVSWQTSTLNLNLLNESCVTDTLLIYLKITLL